MKALFAVLLAAFSAAASEVHVTILATNDIHGGIEPSIDKFGKPYGGMALWAGIAKAIREGLKQKHPERSGMLILDGGDQFQGTLLSNYDEGQLLFATMNEVGYDAAVPGNHDYDFGPIGWLVDSAQKPEERREALLRLVKQAKFPLVSANTFYKDSLVDISGAPVAVENKGCRPLEPGREIDWERAKRPEFLETHVIKDVAGVRVAIIGIDHPSTPETTTAVNVSDLCFGDEYEHYRGLRKKLEGKADIFLLVIHNGDSNNDKGATRLVERLGETPGLVHAVVSGHTHFTYNEKVKGIPIIQSGYGGTSFGRIDLVWDAKERRLLDDKTKSVAGVRMFPKGCDERAKEFCESDGKTVKYEGVAVSPSAAVQSLITRARKEIAPLANRHLGHAHEEITRDRINESPLSNVMTDAFRKASQADIATLNTGGLRDNIRKGDFTYEHLFKILPFSNHALIVGPMPVKNLVMLLERSVATCGIYGALMQSGLRVTYKRDCKDAVAMGGIDKNAKLVRVETLSGQVIYDAENGGLQPNAPSVFTVATLDFLARGGEKYEGFKGVPHIRDMGILREVLTSEFLKSPVELKGQVDGRFKNLLPPQPPG